MERRKSLYAQALENRPVDPNYDLESFRARVLARVRQDHPEALQNPRQNEMYLRNVAALVDPDTAWSVVDSIVKDMLGYGPLQEFVYPDSPEQEGITEIIVYAPDQVRIEKNGSLSMTGAKFMDEKHLLATVQKIVLSCGRRISETEPIVDAYMPENGARVLANLPYGPRPGWMTIRQFPKRFSLEELTENGTITFEAVSFLKQAIRKKYSVVFSGAMNAGKTTLMNACLSLIPEEEDVLVYEDVPELQPEHRNTRFILSRPKRFGAGKSFLEEVSQEQLLRSRADRIVMGECRGKETYYVLQNMCLGTPAMASVHADSAVDACLYRLPSLLVESEEGRALGYTQCLTRVMLAVDLIVHVAMLEVVKERRVVQVAEVLRKIAPGGLAPDPHVIFEWDSQSKKLLPVSEPRLFAEKRKVWT
jgi:pilus assembly protein CpaF